MSVDYRKASDIDDETFVDAITEAMRLRGNADGSASWATRWDVACVLGGVPERLGNHEAVDPVPGVPARVVLAKARRLIRRGVIVGCACGCRGDFRVRL